MAKATGSKKGSPFEREIAKRFSLWWSNEKDDGIFWRSQASGGRATVRTKTGKSTFGQYGDLCAVDPMGQAFIDACCVEMKIGYGNWSVQDVLDNINRESKKVFTDFLEQANQQRNDSGSKWFLLIFKKDRHSTCVVFEKSFYQYVTRYKKQANECTRLTESITIRVPGYEDLLIIRLDDFFTWCPPEYFMARQGY